MHEASLAKNIIEIVETNADVIDKGKIKNIRIRVGELSGIYPESLEYYFHEFTKNSKLEKTELIFEISPIKSRCRMCEKEFIIKDFEYNCPNCNSDKFDIIGGNELEIINMELE